MFFLYGAVRDIVFSPEAKSSVAINLAMLAVWGLTFVTLAIAVTRTRSSLDPATSVMNIAALALLVMTLINIGINYSKIADLAARDKEEPGENTTLTTANARPDIYYIILDRYGRNDAIKASFNYDDSRFLDYLAGKGFYIANQSSSNYPDTETSLPSSLNMRYLTAEEIANPDRLQQHS